VLTAVAVHDLPGGIDGLHSVASAYLAARWNEMRSAPRRDVPLRVTEVLVREADPVSLVGFVEGRRPPSGSYRDDGAARMLAMAGFPRKLAVVPVRSEELRWLVFFDRCVVAGLLASAALAVGGAALAAAAFLRAGSW
jgi:hypothetical protein